jgi:hypothetical protein
MERPTPMKTEQATNDLYPDADDDDPGIWLERPRQTDS